MKLIIPGGTGQIGLAVAAAFARKGHDVVIVSRSTPPDLPGVRSVTWDGRTLGPWARELDGADVVLNLAGRTVNCRYTEVHLAEMMDSRVDSTRVVGEAIAAAARPPRVWLQMSTATIYAHRLEGDHDEATGVIGGAEPDVPAYWARSVAIARAWEDTLAAAPTPGTRKVALRTAMVMGPGRGGIFDTLYRLTRRFLGGPIAGGRQGVSWIHERDFIGAMEFIIARDDIDGAVNIAAPGPRPQREFMAGLRRAAGRRLGLPATAWMARIGAFFMRTDAELVLKSRRVLPGRLTSAGFRFDFERWEDAAKDLVIARESEPD